MNCDGDFHRAVATISGNPIFAVLAQALFDWLAHFHIDLVRQEGMESLTIQEHDAIVDAIEAGNENAAADAMANHLNRANKLYHQKYSALPFRCARQAQRLQRGLHTPNTSLPA